MAATAISAAKILSKRAHNVPGRIKITEYFFEVPHDWSNAAKSRKLTLFARSARRIDRPADPTTEDPKKGLPWMLYLQGGPGFECASPQNSYWIQTILERGYQVLCLDQRGTGLSSPLSPSTLGLRGDDKVQAEYLKKFRADSIVRDCEAIRKALIGDLEEGKKKWSIMGQSFGGFCALTYLSFYPEAVREAFLFGGLPPLLDGPDEVYRRTLLKVIKRNEAYYAKYPEDVSRVQLITKLLQRFGDTTVRDTTSQGSITARRFLQIGIHFGFHGGFDTVHEVVLRCWSDLQFVGHITKPTVVRIEGLLPFNDHMIYSILHEQIYCQGTASNWSCYRMQKEHEELFRIPKDGGDKPIYFTGEMVFPWMLEDYPALQSLKTQADILATTSDWPALYDEGQLAKNDVPVYAAVYMNDMYVDYDFSMETARKLKGCKTFVTNVMYHDAVRSRMEDVTKGLFALRDDTID
ncbi:alpha/beta-hydrolase [Tothia fuscella]|uniref:Alpha/beta-hydrolase n=1 Tax=Tothia fuscella TaxID=1048955 RepID=A0A9P4NY86_9PEZI|nr:alpha/beta-hydrolase [Tothia fuscella]